MSEDFPKDGTTFVTEVVERATYRWTQYKPDGARQMGKPGRFQKMVWKGDFFKWENAEPEGYLVQGDVGPLQARDEALAAKDAEIARLREENEELSSFAKSFNMTCVESSFYKDCYLHINEPDSVSFRIGNGSQFSKFVAALEARRIAALKATEASDA